jgi:hypothetical protein
MNVGDSSERGADMNIMGKWLEYVGIRLVRILNDINE